MPATEVSPLERFKLSLKTYLHCSKRYGSETIYFGFGSRSDFHCSSLWIGIRISLWILLTSCFKFRNFSKNFVNFVQIFAIFFEIFFFKVEIYHFQHKKLILMRFSCNSLGLDLLLMITNPDPFPTFVEVFRKPYPSKNV